MVSDSQNGQSSKIPFPAMLRITVYETPGGWKLWTSQVPYPELHVVQGRGQASKGEGGLVDDYLAYFQRHPEHCVLGVSEQAMKTH